jgi:hypothetical protein
MKESSSHTGNVTTKQLQRIVSLKVNTNEQYMKKCRECDHQATSNDYLTQHQQAIHGGKKFTFRECDYQATSKGDLTQHQQAIHEIKK